MAAGGSDFQSSLDMLLAFDVIEVSVVLRVLVKEIFEVDRGPLNGLGAVQKLDDLRQVAYAQNFDFMNYCGFGGIRLGKNQSFEVFPLRGHCDRQNPAYGFDRSVERQLADQQILLEQFLIDQAFGS